MVSGEPLRVVFFGTPAFAVPTLDALLASRHRVVSVVTQPDRPRGRGQRATYAPVKARALESGLPVLQPVTLKDPTFVGELAGFRADVGVVAAYGKILPEAVLNTPRLGMINVHASLLPSYRGAAPVHRAVMAGERETGVTIIRLVKAMDAGPMLTTLRRPLGPNETSEEVERDLAKLGAVLLVSTLDRLAAGTVTETPQDDSAASYAPRLTREEGLIDWQWPAERIHNLARGLHPWPHAHTFLRGARLIVLRTLVATGCAVDPPGRILLASGDQLRVNAGSGAVNLVEIQLEGKRAMTAREFLAGHRVQPGDQFARQP